MTDASDTAGTNSIDIDRVRADTPAVADLIHFNNAGASLVPQSVLNAQIEFLHLEARIGGYEAAEHGAEAIERTHSAAAELLGTQSHNIAVVESATRAWNTALSAIPFSSGDRVLTTRSEYISNMGGLLYAQERFGVQIDLVPSDASGQVDVDALEDMLDERTRLVSLCHIPTQGGLINPAARIGALTRDTDTIFLIDACQSVGQLDIKVDDIGCDILSFTGRKFVRGPRGTGMVWVNDATIEKMGMPMGLDGAGGEWTDPFVFTPSANARRFEVFESAVSAVVGLGVALGYILELGIDNIEARNRHLSALLRTELSAIDGVQVHDLGEQRSAIVTFSVDGDKPAKTSDGATDYMALKMALRAKKMNVSVTQAGSAQLDFPGRGLQELIRASVHYFNTDDEIARFVEAIAELAG